MSKLAFLPLLPFVLLAGCVSAFGSGHAIEETRQVNGSFSSIAIRHGLHLNVVAGASVSVKVHGDDNLIREISTVVSGDQLIIDMPDMVGDFMSRVEVGATVTLPELKGLTARGGSTVDATGIDVETFALAASGGAEVRVRGRCEALSVEASGGSVIEAFELSAERADLELSGGSVAKLSVSDEVWAQLSGGSDARVRGNPAVRKQSLSGGSSLTLK